MEQIPEPMDVDTSFTTDGSATNLGRENDGIAVSNNETLILPDMRYENRGGTFTTGIDIFSKDEQLKMEERAKRFGLQDTLENPIAEKAEDLYSSMGIEKKNENTKNLRLNVLHMRGTEDMSTKDVFKYFEDYAPASIEWINDVSCNVVWPDNTSAARALLRLSKTIVGLGEKVEANRYLKSEASSFDDENKLANDDSIIDVVEDDGSTGEGGHNKRRDDKVISLKDLDCPLPPGLWRKGADYPKSKAILLRFATRTDKKHPRAEKMSDYYKKYGNPNFGGIKGHLTESRKRIYKQVRQSKNRLDEGLLNDEGKKEGSKNPWGALSQTWGQNDSVEDDFLRPELIKEQTSGVKERLGMRIRAKEADLPDVPTVVGEFNSESSSETSDEEWCKRSKVLRMRMHADDEEEKMLKKRIKQRTQEIYANTQSKGNDLRSRLDNTRKTSAYCEAIQVVVTNSPDKYEVLQPHVCQGADSKVVKLQEEEETEEGEWTDEVDQVEKQAKIEEGDEESEDSDVSEKEIQGPKGSVIKVVPRVKPRVASTVWARLNNTKSGTETEDRSSLKRKLKKSFKGDLRARLGYHNRGRSPLRIEVRNDKYAEESSETE